MKIFKITIITLISSALIILIIADLLISLTTKDYIYSDINQIPQSKVGLLLGTSKYFKDGTQNLYFKYRIEATYKLFKNQKIEKILISGDNSKSYYNEPIDMKKALIKKGIPDSVIYLDYAGFRTYDSIIRAKKIFGLSTYTIISQEYHNQRALYIAKNQGHNPIAFNSKNVDTKLLIGQYFREKLARVKVFIDFIFGTEPKFLGESIEIE